MRAVVISEPGVLPTVREVAAPTCPDDGVVLRVTATGVYQLRLARLDGS